MEWVSEPIDVTKLQNDLDVVNLSTSKYGQGMVYLTYLKTQRQVRNYFHEIKSRDIDHIDLNETCIVFEHFDVFNLVFWITPTTLLYYFPKRENGRISCAKGFAYY